MANNRRLLRVVVVGTYSGGRSFPDGSGPSVGSFLMASSSYVACTALYGFFPGNSCFLGLGAFPREMFFLSAVVRFLRVCSSGKSVWLSLCKFESSADVEVHRVSRSCRDYSVQLDRQRRPRSSWRVSRASGVLTHRMYSHFRRTYAPLVLTRLALRGFVVLAVSVTPGVLSSRSSHTPCVCSLSSRYPSRPACSRRGLLTRLAWARCPRGIRHTRRALVAVFSHALRGLVVFAVSITPGVLSSRSSPSGKKNSYPRSCYVWCVWCVDRRSGCQIPWLGLHRVFQSW